MSRKAKYFIIIFILLFNINFFYNIITKNTFHYNYNFDSRHYSGVIASDLYNIYSTKGVTELKYRFPDHRIIDDIIVIKKSYQKFKDNSYVLDCELSYNYIKNEVLLPSCKTSKIFKDDSRDNIGNFYSNENYNLLISQLESKVGLESINDFITLLVSGYYNEYFYNISKDKSYDELVNSIGYPSGESNFPVFNILKNKIELQDLDVILIYEKKDIYNNNYFIEYKIINNNLTCKVGIINLLLENKEIFRGFNDIKWPKLKIDTDCNLN